MLSKPEPFLKAYSQAILFCCTLYFSANTFAVDSKNTKPSQDQLQALLQRLQKYVNPEKTEKPAPVLNAAGIQNENNEMEVQGLLIDETKTVRGHSFLDSFIDSFDPVLGEKSMITIAELVDPIRGSFIQISVDDRQVFQSVLKPKQDAIEETASAAAEQVSQFIITQFTAPVDSGILDP